MSTRCITPFYKKEDKRNEYIPFPCGKCPNCMRRRTSGWSYRLVKEGERSNSALFITLTYNTESVPISKNGYMTLDKTDLQKFFKRLRKLTNEKIRYYAVGEYGSQNLRPHYHLIMFNATTRNVENAWKLNGVDIGSIYIGDVSDASIGYTLKYMTKEGKIPMHIHDDRKKEFSIMSKGIGANYLSKKMINWHKKDLENRMYIPLKDGKKIAMPRYFKDKMYDEFEKFKISNHIKKKLLEEEELLDKELGEAKSAILAERHLNQFRKMHKNAKQNRNL